MNWMTALRVWVFALALIAFLPVSHADENADANRLFVNALQIITQAKSLDILSRAKAYVEANEAFTEILENYSGSDIAVNLVTGQSIGHFEYQKFLNEIQYLQYISECVSLYSNKCVIAIFKYSFIVTDDIDDTLSKRTALYQLAAAQAEAGLIDDAFRTAESIENARYQAGALGSIATAQAQAGMVDDALKTTERIEDADMKSWALSDITTAQAEAGLVDDALETAESIEDADAKAWALGRIAAAQAEAGLVDEALKTFASALKTAESIEDADAKARALGRPPTPWGQPDPAPVFVI